LGSRVKIGFGVYNSGKSRKFSLLDVNALNAFCHFFAFLSLFLVSWPKNEPEAHLKWINSIFFISLMNFGNGVSSGFKGEQIAPCTGTAIRRRGHGH
jgi:hypothetical protein